MRPIPLAKKLNDFLGEGLSSEIFEAVNFHKVEERRNGASLAPNIEIPMIGSNGVTADEYLLLLDNNAYSAVFKDGAIIIIQASFENDNLKSHRYIYLPCPIRQDYISVRSFNDPLSDWVRDIVEVEGVSSMTSRGYVRFDYIKLPDDPIDPHPVSHMTFGSGDCRVPVHSPLSISAFLNFIFDNFYRQHRRTWLEYSSHLTCYGIEETITREEQLLHHLSSLAAS